MLSILCTIWLRDHAAHLAALQLVLVSLLTGGVALAAARAPQSASLAAAPAGAVELGPRLQPTEISAAREGVDSGLIRLQDLDPDEARRWNAANPISSLPNPAAKPFRLKAASVLDETRAIDCLTAAIYYEAAHESLDGQRAVAQVVLNRMRHPAFPKSVCGVVFQGSERATACQFTFTCDGSLKRQPHPAGWSRARQVAIAALNGHVMKKVGNATHYHANYVAPYWSPSLVKVASIGAHIFYRWTGGWGLPPAFGGRYQGGESTGVQVAALDGLVRDEARLQLAALTVEAAAPAAAPVVESAPSAGPAALPSEAAAVEMITAAEALAPESETLVKDEDLDWAGRPKPKGPPRIPVPGDGGGLSPY